MGFNGRQRLIVGGVSAALVVAACSSGEATPTESAAPDPTPTATAPANPAPATATPVQQPPGASPTLPPAIETPTAQPTIVPTPTRTPLPTFTPNATQRLGITSFITTGWKTNFEKHNVEYDEIFSAQVKDGIASVDRPTFETPDAASEWLTDRDPVVAVELNGVAKAYPLAILLWHEIVNDEIGGTPVVVTFCPLCNTALVFERVVNGEPVEFGTTGNLRNSDLIMYDRTTESWWQQITGTAIVGDLTGTQLTFVPATIVSFGDFRDAFTEGQVLSKDTGFGGLFDNNYGINPYSRYDSDTNDPFLFFGERDIRLPLMERVVGVAIGGQAKAYPFDDLKRERVVHDEIGGQAIVVFWKSGTASALDNRMIATSKDVGATGVFLTTVGDRELTFQSTDDGFTDEETGSLWNIFGKAIAGPLAGEQLEPVIHANHFWFAWVAFSPDTLIHGR